MISTLSVILITRNEEEDIEDCLRSVAGIAGEIVVVDSGSTNRTLEICRRYTNKIFPKEWSGYGAHKQYALEQAKGPWILNIDADERVSEQLRDELKALLASSNGSFNGFEIPFRHFFLSKLLRFGASRGEKHIRLFKKEESSYGPESVHEGINVRPPIGRLKGGIDHFSYRDIDEYLKKCNHYTSMIAQEKFSAGERFHFWHHLRLPYEFAVRYGLKLGFLDGEAGLTYALLSSYYVWLKFMKLRDLEKR